jgi:hypothetical protein
MTLEERLKNLFEKAGASPQDIMQWQTAIRALPFNKRELMVYLLERLNKEDILFLNKNLGDKIAMIRAMDAGAIKTILEEEKTYLSMTGVDEEKQ